MQELNAAAVPEVAAVPPIDLPAPTVEPVIAGVSDENLPEPMGFESISQWKMQTAAEIAAQERKEFRQEVFCAALTGILACQNGNPGREDCVKMAWAYADDAARLEG